MSLMKRSRLVGVLLGVAVTATICVELRSRSFPATVASAGQRASAVFAAALAAPDARGPRVAGSLLGRGEYLVVASKEGEKAAVVEGRQAGGEGDAPEVEKDARGAGHDGSLGGVEVYDRNGDGEQEPEEAVSGGGEAPKEPEETVEPGGTDTHLLLRRAPRVEPALRGRSGGGASEETEAEGGATDNAGKDAQGETCASYIVYDKPMKTGSTAMTDALGMYLATLGQSKFPCDVNSCAAHAQEMCDGERAPKHLLNHMVESGRVLDCLRGLRFYAVTTIRDPLLRWESAFLYNRGKRTHHYGIPWNASYESFMMRMPPCALLFYYDGQSRFCDGEPVQERVRKIVRRYDEIVDFSEEPTGQVHELVAPYLTTLNKSPRPMDPKFRSQFDMGRLANETLLYDALRKRREDILKRKQRPLC